MTRSLPGTLTRKIGPHCRPHPMIVSIGLGVSRSRRFPRIGTPCGPGSWSIVNGPVIGRLASVNGRTNRAASESTNRHCGRHPDGRTCLTTMALHLKDQSRQPIRPDGAIDGRQHQHRRPDRATSPPAQPSAGATRRRTLSSRCALSSTPSGFGMSGAECQQPRSPRPRHVTRGRRPPGPSRLLAPECRQGQWALAGPRTRRSARGAGTERGKSPLIVPRSRSPAG